MIFGGFQEFDSGVMFQKSATLNKGKPVYESTNLAGISIGYTDSSYQGWIINIEGNGWTMTQAVGSPPTSECPPAGSHEWNADWSGSIQSVNMELSAPDCDTTGKEYPSV